MKKAKIESFSIIINNTKGKNVGPSLPIDEHVPNPIVL
jgi:hypothetical protein